MRYNYPKLSDKEKQAYRDRHDHFKKASNSNETKGDNINAAVFMYLGDVTSDSESDDQDNKRSVSFWEDDDSISDDDDGDNEVDKDA